MIQHTIVKTPFEEELFTDIKVNIYRIGMVKIGSEIYSDKGK